MLHGVVPQKTRSSRDRETLDMHQILHNSMRKEDESCVYYIWGRNTLNPFHRPLSRRLNHCDRVIQNESRDPFGGNVYYVTMQIRFFTRKFWNGERNLHCDVVPITTKWVSSLTLDCNGVFAIKAYGLGLCEHS